MAKVASTITVLYIHFSIDDVIPGLTKEEFRLRRQKLIDTIMEIDEEVKVIMT